MAVTCVDILIIPSKLSDAAGFVASAVPVLERTKSGSDVRRPAKACPGHPELRGKLRVGSRCKKQAVTPGIREVFTPRPLLQIAISM